MIPKEDVSVEEEEAEDLAVQNLTPTDVMPVIYFYIVNVNIERKQLITIFFKMVKNVFHRRVFFNLKLIISL